MNKFIEYRREFHHFPEQGWDEVRTTSRIYEILTDMGYDCLMGLDVVDYDTIDDMMRTPEERRANMDRAIAQGAKPEIVEMTKGFPGVIATFDTGRPGPVTAFRFDIDCLPGKEPHKEGFRPYDEGYISCNEGCVHACGHDAHTAMGLGIAEALLSKRDQFKGKIKLIFQPSEEVYHGAESVVAKGHLDDVDHFICMHVALSAEGRPLGSHTMCCGCKDFLSDRQIDVTFHGYGAHPCGAAQEGRDAMLAACSAVLNLRTIADHELGLTRVNVGIIRGGTVVNSIPDECFISLECRGETPEISEYVERRVFEVLDGAAKMHGCTYDCYKWGLYPASKSDDAMMEIIERAAHKVPWFEKVYYEGSIGGSDDAAAMMNAVKEHGGITTYLGIGTDTTQAVHNDEFDLDEECIPAAIDMCMYALEEIHGM